MKKSITNIVTIMKDKSFQKELAKHSKITDILDKGGVFGCM